MGTTVDRSSDSSIDAPESPAVIPSPALQSLASLRFLPRPRPLLYSALTFGHPETH